MKKSRLKYIYIAILLWSIFGLYQWNRKFFESTDSLGRKKSPVASSNSFSSGESADFNGGFGGGFSSEASDEPTANSSSTPSNNGLTPIGFHSSGLTSSSSTYNNSTNEGYESTENIVPDLASNSSGGGASNSVANYGGGISLGIPLINSVDKEEEEEKKKEGVSKTINTNQTAARDKFFSGNVELPMAPLPPNKNIPLDGGASIILVLGSILGLKKLLGGKKANV